MGLDRARRLKYVIRRAASSHMHLQTSRITTTSKTRKCRVALSTDRTRSDGTRNVHVGCLTDEASSEAYESPWFYPFHSR